MDIYNIVNQMRMNHQTIFDLKIRVTYYARVSTLREEQDSSIEHQIEFFKKTINEHPNWTYVEGYVDRIRGETAANRENFMRMIEDGKNGLFDLILTKEVSRFARNTLDSLTYTRELLKCGVGVFFQNDNICTVDSDSEFRLTIMSSIAQDEMRKLSERVKFGHNQSIKKGIVMGNSRIYGYEKNKGKLVINEKEAEMVRFVFEWYSSGKYAIREIVRKLYNLGYRNSHGKKIEHSTITGIITNPKYKGYYCGNKVKIADYRTKEQVFLPEEEWVMYKDETGEIVPAIVDEDIWSKANELYKKRSEDVKNRGRGRKTTSVLSGKIFCTHHGKLVSLWRTSYSHAIHKDGNIYQWICSTKKKDGTACCPTFAIYEWELYDILTKFFTDIVEDIDEYINTFLEIYQKYDETENVKTDIEKLKQTLERNNLKKERLLDLYMDSSISNADYKKQNDKINAEIEEINKQIDALVSKTKSLQSIKKDLQNIKDTLFSFSKSEVAKFTQEEVDVFIGYLVDHIEITSTDKHCMDLNIILRNNSQHNVKLSRCSGHTLQKICPEQQIETIRTFGRMISKYIYIVYASIEI